MPHPRLAFAPAFAPVFALLIAALSPGAAAAEAGDGAAAPVISIRPLSLSLTHDFRKPEKNEDEQQQMMRVWMGGMDATKAAGCTVGLGVLLDQAWTLVSVSEPTQVKATLDSGETVVAPVVDQRFAHLVVRQQKGHDIFYGQRQQPGADPVGVFLVRCAAPVQPATVIRELTGTIEVTAAANDTIKRMEVAMARGVSAPVPIPGCDVVLGQNDKGQITVDYAQESSRWICEFAYLDGDGEECQPNGTMSQGGDSRTKLELTFAKPIVTVAIGGYTALRVFSVDFSVKDLPFVGATPADVLEARRVAALRELSVVMPSSDEAGTPVDAMPSP